MHEALDYVRGVSQMLMKKVEILEGHFKLRRSAGVSAPLNFVNNWPHHSRHCPHFISPSALASLPVYNFRVSTHLSASNYSFPPPTFKPFTVSHIFVRDIEWIESPLFCAYFRSYPHIKTIILQHCKMELLAEPCANEAKRNDFSGLRPRWSATKGRPSL